MAYIETPTEEQITEWRAWVAERPADVRAVAERFNPWSLYRLKSTGQHVVIYSFSDGPDVTLTVSVLGQFNMTLFESEVFGINPDDLEPCELPSPDERVGAMLSQDEVIQNIDALRVAIRPDLFVMGDDGCAIRKN